MQTTKDGYTDESGSSTPDERFHLADAAECVRLTDLLDPDSGLIYQQAVKLETGHRRLKDALHTALTVLEEQFPDSADTSEADRNPMWVRIAKNQARQTLKECS